MGNRYSVFSICVNPPRYPSLCGGPVPHFENPLPFFYGGKDAKRRKRKEGW